MPRKTEPDAPDESSVDETPEPMRHPAAPDYVLQDGQWAYQPEEPKPEAEAEAVTDEEG